MSTFKQRYSVDERWQESTRVVAKYPGRIPVICERSTKTSTDVPPIDKYKYLVPKELTTGEFLYVIRKRLKLKPEKAIYLFINGVIPSSSQLLGDVYDYHKDPDGFLYIIYSFENTFGKK